MLFIVQGMPKYLIEKVPTTQPQIFAKVGISSFSRKIILAHS
jgi:hypothetical protein